MFVQDLYHPYNQEVDTSLNLPREASQHSTFCSFTNTFVLCNSLLQTTHSVLFQNLISNNGVHLFVRKCVHINPRRACATRVTVLGLSVSLCVCLSTTILALQATKRHQRDTNSSSATSARIMNKRFFLKRRRSRSRNWHSRGPRCVIQPIN